MMSWIDGFELCRAVKKNDEFRDIPVIFISAKKTASDIRTGMAAQPGAATAPAAAAPMRPAANGSTNGVASNGTRPPMAAMARR